MPSERFPAPSQQPAERGDASDQDSITDSNAAWEAAHAEKPARDYIAEYKGQLSDEARTSLEWIASQEAEKALKRYEETQNEEDPIVRVLRERALGSIEFPQKIRYEIESQGDEQKSHWAVTTREWLAGCEWALRDLGAELVEETIADKDMELSQKKASLERLGFGLEVGIEGAFQGRTIDPHDKTWNPMADELDIGWGNLIGNLMAGNGIETIEYLRHQVSPRVLEDTMDFLTRARIAHPKIVKGLDEGLSKRGWLWDKKQNKYIGMP